jgi:hypothetical protein
MEYLIGVILALAVAGFATVTGLDRGRAFYTTVLIVIASYYVLFAVMGASGRTLGMEIVVASGFFFSCHTRIQKESLVSGCCPGCTRVF